MVCCIQNTILYPDATNASGKPIVNKQFIQLLIKIFHDGSTLERAIDISILSNSIRKQQKKLHLIIYLGRFIRQFYETRAIKINQWIKAAKKF